MKTITVNIPSTTDLNAEIARLKAEIAAIKAKEPKTRKPRAKGIQMLTPSIRKAKEEETVEDYKRRLRKLLDSPLGQLTPTEVVDATAGWMADLA